MGTMLGDIVLATSDAPRLQTVQIPQLGRPAGGCKSSGVLDVHGYFAPIAMTRA